MLDKKVMDDFFVSIIPMLKKIAKGVLYQNKKYIDIDVVISEAYIHMMNNQEKIKTTDQLQRLVVQFINMNIIWTNSQLSKKNVVEESIMSVDEYEDYFIDDDENNFIVKQKLREYEEEMQGIETKLELERWYDEKKAILALYRAQEKDKVKAIIYDCYFIKNITKGVNLAKHLGINKDYACKYIRELKADIKEFYKEWMLNNK